MEEVQQIASPEPERPSREESTPPMVVVPGALCGECKTTPITGTYWAMNAHAVCPACHARLQGSFKNALALGLAAALGNIALYYLVYWVVDMRFVFIAVLAGVSIGASVRKGAQASAMLRYRWLAVVLTYLATAATYAHSLIEIAGLDHPARSMLRSLYLPLLMVIRQQNLVTLVLLGFGLHEAWKFSAAPYVHAEGPFDVNAPSAPVSPARPVT